MQVEGGGGDVLRRLVGRVWVSGVWEVGGYLGGVQEETAAFGAGVEAREGDDGARDCLLREVQEDAGGLGEERAGVADVAFEGGGEAVQAGGGG